MWLENAGQLLPYFQLSLDDPNCNAFGDRKVGFSLQREYPANIRFKAPRAQNGQADTIALIKVLYRHPSETSNQPIGDKVPIFLSIYQASRYLLNHLDYSDSDLASPTRASVIESRSTPQPAPLESADEYYFDHNKNALCDSKGNIIPGQDIINNLFEQHISTVHIIKGIKLRWKLGSRFIGIKILDALAFFFEAVMRRVFGRRRDADSKIFDMRSDYTLADYRLHSTDGIDVFGYRASKQMIVIGSFLVLVSYTAHFYFPIQWGLPKRIWSNGYLTTCSTILLLWLGDHLLPRVLLTLINFTKKMKYNLLFIKFKA